MNQKYYLAEESTIGHDTSYYLNVGDDGQMHVESDTSFDQPYKNNTMLSYHPPELSGRIVNGKSLATLVTEKLSQISN